MRTLIIAGVFCAVACSAYATCGERGGPGFAALRANGRVGPLSAAFAPPTDKRCTPEQTNPSAANLLTRDETRWIALINIRMPSQAPLCHPLTSFVSTCSQEGQTKMNCSKRAPSFGIVRRCCMVSPHEGHVRTGVLSGTCAEHSMAEIEGV